MHLLVIGDVSSRALENFHLLTDGEYDTVENLSILTLNDIRRELHMAAYELASAMVSDPAKHLWPLADSYAAKWYPEVGGILIAGLSDDPAGLVASIIELNELGESDLDTRIWRVKTHDEIVPVTDKSNCCRRINNKEIEAILLIGAVDVEQVMAFWSARYIRRHDSQLKIVMVDADDVAIRRILDEHEEFALRPALVFVPPVVPHMDVWDDVKDSLFLARYWSVLPDGSIQTQED